MIEARLIPLDVRLMNVSAAVLFVLVCAMFAVGIAGELLRSPRLAVAGITVEGVVANVNVPSVRANALPRLSGNFITMDLRKARESFERVPWVRRAVVQREFPNRLRVRLEEHVPVALWGEDGESRMVNIHGEVFEAPAAEQDVTALIRFIGPEGQATTVFEMHKSLVPLFTRLDWDMESLELTHRGGWRVVSTDGAVMELGRGELVEVVARVHRFVRTVEAVVARYGRSITDIESVDLRYPDGYALRIRGVGRVEAAPVAVPAPGKDQQR